MKKRNILSYLVLPFVLVSCVTNTDPQPEPEPEVPKTIEVTDIRSIHTDLQKEYIYGIYSQLPSSLSPGASEKSKPAPIVINVEDSTEYSKSQVSEYTLKVSKSSEFETYKEYASNTGTFSLTNLNINCCYYYKYDALVGDQTYESDIKGFYIEDECPRNIDIEGVTNVRDIGGWKIAGTNKHIPQNLLYRSAKLNSSSSTNITQKGMEQFAELGIKTEIDLRNTQDEDLPDESVLPGVSYYHCDMVNSSNISSDLSKQGIKKTMQILADKDNYPILYHCTYGADRTGFISFALEALAGVEEETLYKDYMWTNFASIGGKRSTSIISGYINDMRYRSGCNDIGLGVEAFLLSIGVTQAEIDSIKAILTGEEENYFDGHTPKDNWEKVDENKHSLFCDECGDPLVTEEHIFTAPFVKLDDNDNHFIKCKKCGYEKSFAHSYIDGICECGKTEPGNSKAYSFTHPANQALSNKDLSSITNSNIDYSSYIVLDMTLDMDYIVADSSKANVFKASFTCENGDTYGFGLGNECPSTVNNLSARILTPTGAWKGSVAYIKLMREPDFDQYLLDGNKFKFQARMIINNLDLTIKMYFRIAKASGGYTDWLESSTGCDAASVYEDKHLPAPVANIYFTHTRKECGYTVSNLHYYSSSEAQKLAHNPSLDS